MGFFQNKNKRKYDPEIVSKSASFVLIEHDSSIIAQGEVQILRDQASKYAKEKFGVVIPPNVFLHLIKKTDLKESENRTRIVKHYKKDKSIERTASHFKTSAQTVKKILKEYGLSITTGLQTALFILMFNNLAYAELIDEPTGSFKELMNYGALGVVCFLLIVTLGYHIKTHKQERTDIHSCHAKERREWRESEDKKHAESMRMTQKAVEVMTELKAVINARNSNL